MAEINLFGKLPDRQVKIVPDLFQAVMDFHNGHYAGKPGKIQDSGRMKNGQIERFSEKRLDSIKKIQYKYHMNTHETENMLTKGDTDQLAQNYREMDEDGKKRQKQVADQILGIHKIVNGKAENWILEETNLVAHLRDRKPLLGGQDEFRRTD